MKKIYVCLLGLILLALVFFTFYGGQLYEIGKPLVQTAAVGTWMGEDDLLIPGEALREDENGDYVFVLCSESGYSRMIYTVERREIWAAENSREGDGYVHVSPHGNLRRGDRVVTEADGALYDGARVLPKT